MPLPADHHPLDAEDHVVADPAHLSFAFGEESVILHAETEQFYELNALGTRIWSLIREPHSVDALCARVLEAYEAEPDAVRRYVLAFLEDLRTGGLIRVHAASSPR